MTVEHTPDKWVIVRVRADLFDIHYRVLAGWENKFNDSWRLNSGIINFVEEKYNYYFYGDSGSVYICRKDKKGFTKLSKSIFNSYNIKYGNNYLEKIKIGIFKNIFKDKSLKDLENRKEIYGIKHKSSL